MTSPAALAAVTTVAPVSAVTAASADAAISVTANVSVAATVPYTIFIPKSMLVQVVQLQDAFEEQMERLPSATHYFWELPPELKFPLCKENMRDAALTSKCCFQSFCDNCRRKLTKSGTSVEPMCFFQSDKSHQSSSSNPPPVVHIESGQATEPASNKGVHQRFHWELLKQVRQVLQRTRTNANAR
ncbi:hypothetical protein Rs2_21428 [Raphanus sativus]|nr:hypothetical protein Rs2_21428 [Raphanus sativus]